MRQRLASFTKAQLYPPDTAGATLVEAIALQLQEVLDQEGLLIQYTYRVIAGRSPLTTFFERTMKKTVWWNLPPAKVEIFRRST